jgi:hypothetical protein
MKPGEKMRLIENHVEETLRKSGAVKVGEHTWELRSQATTNTPYADTNASIK